MATNLPARLTTLGGQGYATLLDISLTGARIFFSKDSYFAAQLCSRDMAELIWEDYSAFGTIVWIDPQQTGFRCGLHFEQNITPAVLIATRDLQDQFWADGGFRKIERENARQWVQGPCL